MSLLQNQPTTVKANKANGYDDVTFYFYINAVSLSTTFNHCISYSLFPNKLKIAKVVSMKVALLTN